MTPEQRRAALTETIWYWLPARWTDGIKWIEIINFDITDEGVDILASLDGAVPVNVSFTDAELLGESRLAPDVAKARIEAA